MKQLFLILCIVPLLLACSSDEKGDNPDSIIGDWEITYTKGYEEYGENKKDVWDKPVSGNYRTFNSDGSGYSYSDENPTKDNYTWSIKGDQLEMSYSDGKKRLQTIELLTSNKLILYSSTSYYENTNTFKRIK